MMDSFELNKILGAILGTVLFVHSLNIAAGALFTAPKPAKPGYEIAVPEHAPGPSQPGVAEPETPIATRLASADPRRGEQAARACAACHTFEKGGPNRVGPNLWGIVNEPKGQGRNFNFSAAMKAAGGTWTFEDLDKFLANPRQFIPGTSMSFAGVPQPGRRADIIAYLNSLSDHPAPLPKAAEGPADAPKQQ
jgi:cytochrome c